MEVLREITDIFFVSAAFCDQQVLGEGKLKVTGCDLSCRFYLPTLNASVWNRNLDAQHGPEIPSLARGARRDAIFIDRSLGERVPLLEQFRI
jgi:hypothetical protein